MDKKQKAFTLIELLLVLAVIALLVSIVAISLKGVREKARIAKALQFSQGIQNVLGADIVLNLSFDDQAYPTKDASGYGNNGTVNVTSPGGFTSDTPHKFLGAGPAQGKFALYFDGNDYVSIPHSSSLKPFSQITIEAWVKPNVGTLNAAREIYRKEDGTDRHLLSFQNSANCSGGGGTGGCIAFGISTGGIYAELDVNIAASDWEGGWHHVVATYGGSNKKIFRDGVEIGSVAATGAIGTSGTAPAIIGSLGGTSEFFNGTIDEVRIYSQALTTAEIQKHYVEGVARHGIALK